MDWSLASRIVISPGRPFSIFVFLCERRKQRERSVSDAAKRRAALKQPESALFGARPATLSPHP